MEQTVIRLASVSGHRSSSQSAHSPIDIGAIVEVRIDADGKMKWVKGKVTGFHKITREWDIKLDTCDDPKCDGCQECKYPIVFGSDEW